MLLGRQNVVGADVIRYDSQMKATQNSQNFYQSLPNFNDPADLLSAHHYTAVPNDWWAVLTDVKGSTEAIQSGRYKDVNTVGVCGIISVQNALQDREFPFVFGGDGASLLVHESDLDAALRALSHTRQIAKDQFQFELRIAAVPVHELVAAGREIRIAKLELSPQNNIALFQGGGLGLAEKMMKDPDSKRTLPADYPQQGEHAGLECRWNPIPAKKGHILALIVQARDSVSDPSTVYAQILREVLGSGSMEDSRPVTLDNIPVTWPPQFLMTEVLAKYQRLAQQLWAQVRILGFMAFAYFALALKMSDAKSKPGRYMQQLVRNTDFLKFDDCLRMIIDVDDLRLHQINTVLERHFTAGEIYFGTHIAPHALMTCFVQSPYRHIHFVDADRGGYAMAAQMLKRQKPPARSLVASLDSL